MHVRFLASNHFIFLLPVLCFIGVTVFLGSYLNKYYFMIFGWTCNVRSCCLWSIDMNQLTWFLWSSNARTFRNMHMIVHCGVFAGRVWSCNDLYVVLLVNISHYYLMCQFYHVALLLPCANFIMFLFFRTRWLSNLFSVHLMFQFTFEPVQMKNEDIGYNLVLLLINQVFAFNASTAFNISGSALM